MILSRKTYADTEIIVQSLQKTEYARINRSADAMAVPVYSLLSMSQNIHFGTFAISKNPSPVYRN